MIRGNETIHAGTNFVKQLRIEKLSNGLPFMINSEDLPSKQCYLEYPNGIIKLATISTSGRDFVILKEYTLTESNSIRQCHNLG